MAKQRHSAHTYLVQAVLSYLELHRIPAWKNNTGAAKVGERFVRFGSPGSPDILGLIPPWGVLLAIECKTGAGRLTSDQQAFRDIIVGAGGVYVLARGVEDVAEHFRGALPGAEHGAR